MKKLRLLPLLLALSLLLTACADFSPRDTDADFSAGEAPSAQGLSSIPAFTDSSYVIIRDNVPDFTEEEMTTEAFEAYSPLDALGRCGEALACIGKEIMPTEERGSIGQIKPSGWQTVKYDIVDGKYLYNRCHLIGFQLTGENANERNLITGTRYMNTEGMLPFENMVADYIKETNNHVLYRVTPVYDGNNLVATGVQLEARSVEDDGEGICFHVFVYNSQPGVSINYADGSSRLSSDTTDFTQGEAAVGEDTFILNKNSKKFHTDGCSQGASISEKNREEYTGDRQTLIDDGYEPAGCCKP